MAVFKKGGDFERADKVERTAPIRKAKESSQKNLKPGTADEVRKTSQKNLKPGTADEVQSLLTDLGYEPGPSGKGIGPSGRRAIERHQAER